MVLTSDTTYTKEPIIIKWTYDACVQVAYYPEYETISCDDIVAKINRIITVPQIVMLKIRQQYKFLKRFFKSHGLKFKIVDRNLGKIYVGV